MKTIQLKTLKLNFFKGTIERTVEFGKNTNIFAENEGEKTTLFDALCYGLFGKDSNNKKDFEIKTYCTTRNQHFFKDNEIGDVIHNLDHSVEQVWDVDGKKLILKRTLKEVWVKKRNELKGHTTIYEIDGLSVLEKVYNAKIAEIIDEKLFRLLTDAKYFNSSNYAWTDRRNILMQLGGGDEETEIEGYDLVKDILNGRTSDQQKTHIKAQRKKINDQLTTIEPKIEENTRMIVEVDGDKMGIEDIIDNSAVKKIELENRIKDMKSDSGADERRRNISLIDSQILEKQNKFNQAKQTKLAEIQERGNALRDEENVYIIEVKNLIDETERLKSVTSESVSKRGSILAEWQEVNNSVISQSLINKITCPECNHNFIHGDSKEAIDSFNINKSNRLEELNADGAEIVEKIKQLESQVISDEKIQSIRDSVVDCQKKIEVVSTEYREENAKVADVSELENKKTAIGNPASSPVDTMALENDIIAIDALITKSKKSILDLENNQKNRDRIKELEADQKRLGLEFAKLETDLTLIEAFTVAKVGHIEETINDMFQLTRFKMFHQLINGGVEEVCESLKDGVPYNSVNNAGQLQMGADICNTLQIFHGVSLPMFFDNRESVSEMPAVQCQTVSLYVSPEDTTMWIGSPEERELFLIEKAKEKSAKA